MVGGVTLIFGRVVMMVVFTVLIISVCMDNVFLFDSLSLSSNLVRMGFLEIRIVKRVHPDRAGRLG